LKCRGAESIANSASAAEIKFSAESTEHDFATFATLSHASMVQRGRRRALHQMFQEPAPAKACSSTHRLSACQLILSAMAVCRGALGRARNILTTAGGLSTGRPTFLEAGKAIPGGVLKIKRRRFQPDENAQDQNPLR
jgi:hypothetical protein